MAKEIKGVKVDTDKLKEAGLSKAQYKAIWAHLSKKEQEEAFAELDLIINPPSKEETANTKVIGEVKL